MNVTLQRHNGTPMYRQIVNQVRQQIEDGTLRSGMRLPPVRQVAAECSVTRLTVHSAYAELQAQGLLESHVGRGTFVAPGAVTELSSGAATVSSEWVSRQVLANLLRWGETGELVSFAQAFPAPETYPTEALARAMSEVVSKAGSLGYGHIQGEPVLRREIAALLRERAMSVSSDSLLITAGAQQGIDVAMRALTVPGDTVLMLEPVYPGALERAVLGGRTVIGIPNPQGELSADALEAVCRAHRPRLLYLVPTWSNPTGLSSSRASRAAILAVAEAHNLLVLEDDSYGFLGFGRSSPPALQSADRDQRVIYITSFSKMLAPALRLGVLVAPAAIMPRLAEAKQSSDLVCSAFMQRALAQYLSEGQFQAHLRAARLLYAERCTAMLAALQRHLPECTWTRPEGGLSVWVDLPHGVVERDVMADALQNGVGIAPGSAFFAQPQPRASMRLSFGTHPPERIEEGVSVLGRVVQAHLSRREDVQFLHSGAAGPLV